MLRYSLQASARGTYTDQSASAQASDGTTLSVTQSGDAVNLAQVTGASPYVIVFSAVDAFGNLNSATRTVHVVDATNPTITALATADGQVNPVTMLQGGTIDPAVNTLTGYLISDNLDPSPTVSISGTGVVRNRGDCARLAQ